MRITIIILLVSSLSFITRAQTAAEILSMSDVVKMSDHKKVYADLSKNNNELQFVFSGLFLMYKTFISSQDSYTCAFTPSCSEYGLHSIKHKGIFIGFLSTFDRLSRCNGLSPEKYEIDRKTGKFYDPVL